MPVITLTTDFGEEDAYVGIMKGVILQQAPAVRLVDLCHQVPPQDIRRGAFVLWSAVDVFAAGTIHLAVVDPGVGGERRPVVLVAGGQLFVGPDNGLLVPAARRLGTLQAFHLDRPAFFRSSISATFHGRDIFAPVAAHLAQGIAPQTLGTPLADPVDLVLFDARIEENALCGKILCADRFGNLVTNITAQQIAQYGGMQGWSVLVAGQRIAAIDATFSDVAPQQPVAYLNSFGLLEVALRNASAATLWGVLPDTPLRLERRLIPRHPIEAALPKP